MEISHNNANEEVVRKIMINELKVVEMSVKRHILGWVETVDWTVIGEKRPTEKRTFNTDGLVFIPLAILSFNITATRIYSYLLF